jgi:two-component system, LytTR family, sensor kinase
MRTSFVHVQVSGPEMFAARPLAARGWGLAAKRLTDVMRGLQSGHMSARREDAVAPFWLWNAAAWIGIGLISATQTVFVMRSQGMHHAWTALFVAQLLAWVPWAMATPILFRTARRFPPIEAASRWYIAIHVGACGAVAITTAAWVALLERLMNPWAMNPHPPPYAQLWIVRFENGLLQAVFLYVGIVAVSYALETRDRLLRQEAEGARLNDQLAQARLHALQQQFEPHFLFNALNAVAGLVRDHRNDTAVRAIAGLSDCLRRVLRGSDGVLVTVTDELEFVEKYLDLQRLRFGDALQLTIDIPRELLTCQVPNLVLQPIVDNAIKHGIAQQARRGAIRICATGSDETLTLTVYNDGPKLTPRPSAGGFGIGLSNLEARLRMLYGDAFRLGLKDAHNGVLVSVTLPLRR